MTTINEEVQARLDIPFIEKRTVRMPDGNLAEYPVAGPLQMKFENRIANCNVFVLPLDSEPLLGSISFGEMDVVINAKQQAMTINPTHPDCAQLKMKIINYKVIIHSAIMRQFFLAFLILNCWSCNNNIPCNLGTAKRIQTIYESNNGIVSYDHEIELKGVSLNCDSLTLMTTIKKYIELNIDATPIDAVSVFKSMENFDSGESLSQRKEYWHDRVLKVYFNKATNLPELFMFYYEGHKIYEGNSWTH